MAGIEKCMAEYGIKDLEDARAICLERGIDVDAIVKGVQPIAFENASWAYTLGAAVAINPFELPVSGLVAGINSSLVIDIPVMLVVMSILTLPTLAKQKLSRWQGILLLAIYTAFLVLQFAI